MMLMMHHTYVYEDDLDGTMELLRKAYDELKRLKDWRRINNISVRSHNDINACT